MLNPLLFLKRITFTLIFLAVALFVISFVLDTSASDDMPIAVTQSPESPLIDFDESLFENFTSKNKILLEKIKEEILFFGSIKRPKEPVKHYFYLKDTNTLIALKNKEVFVIANGIEINAECSNQEALVELSKEDENITFKLSKSEPHVQFSIYKIGGIQVDSAFLIKSKAKLGGIDLFMQRHGDKEGFYRLDFEVNSLFIKEGSLLYYDNNVWKDQIDEKKAPFCPIIYIQKIDEKSMQAILYPPHLPVTFPLTIGKYPDLTLPPKASSSFIYTGSRNLKEWLFEVDGKKVSIKEGHWWLYTEGSWRLLDSENDIDDYVERRLVGELFIVDCIEREEGEKVLKGHSYNTLRTKEHEICLPIKAKKTQNSSPYTVPPSHIKKLPDPPRVSYAN